MNVNYMDAPELRQVVQELRRYPAEVKRLQIIAANRDLTIRRLLLEVEILRDFAQYCAEGECECYLDPETGLDEYCHRCVAQRRLCKAVQAAKGKP